MLQQVMMWPRLVANQILKKRLVGSSNFVADFPSDTQTSDHSAQSTLTLNAVFDDDHHRMVDVHNYKLFVSTWNVGGIEPTEDLKLDDWIDPSCDIYVFGFQEVVPLKASNVVAGAENSKASRQWNWLIRKALNNSNNESDEEFKCIISKQMVGILISVWVRPTLRPFVKHQSVSCVACGLMGCLPNKGSVTVRFHIHETSFCFVCSHLASGGRQGDEKHRNSNVKQILSRTIFPKGPFLDLPQYILDHDRVIWFGDLNYRISLPEATTRLFVDTANWSPLLQNDQLGRELMEGQVFEGWEEGAIKFAPTYKYFPKSDIYFGGHKVKQRRAPAWCDRIIWFGEGLKQHSYSRGESKLSDHRPVKAVFATKVVALQRLEEIQGFFLSQRFEKISSDNFNVVSSQGVDFLI